ncbi:MAG: hypothetical protein V4582_25015 [Pseudomonadota bacterium]
MLEKAAAPCRRLRFIKPLVDPNQFKFANAVETVWPSRYTFAYSDQLLLEIDQETISAKIASFIIAFG